MSSAILYLAIVAIWACVLIPRWLRRDSTRGAAHAAPEAYPADGLTTDELPGDGLSADGLTDEYDKDETGVLTSHTPAAPAVPAALPPAESRRRMLTARRRLLLMLLGLEIAAIALAVLGLAAVWVVVPPTVMLGGYLLLLREAAAADAEQQRREFEATEQALARETRAQQRARDAALSTTPAEGMAAAGVPDAAAELAARFAAAPVPADYEEAGPGRDFAPGLAGKYTTSNADAEDEEYGYEAPRLRAVGD